MTRILLKQFIPKNITEGIRIGNEQDVRGNLGFFDRFILPDIIKVIDSGNRRTYVWFIRVPVQDSRVESELRGLPLQAYLANKLFSAGEEGQKIKANVDIIRKDDKTALIKLTLRVEAKPV